MVLLPEYTVVSLGMVLVTYGLDWWGFRTKLVVKRNYWIYLLVMSIFFYAANQFLTCQPVVLYEERFQLGVRFGCVPVEDYLFNISLVTLPIILWEGTKRKNDV